MIKSFMMFGADRLGIEGAIGKSVIGGWSRSGGPRKGEVREQAREWREFNQSREHDNDQNNLSFTQGRYVLAAMAVSISCSAPAANPSTYWLARLGR